MIWTRLQLNGISPNQTQNFQFDSHRRNHFETGRGYNYLTCGKIKLAATCAARETRHPPCSSNVTTTCKIVYVGYLFHLI